MTWDTAVPAGSDPISQGDNVIRELKADVQTALRGDAVDGIEAKFPGADPANPIFRYRGLKGTTGARPAAGQYGLYFDTTRQVLQRDNGSTWDDIAGGIGIVSGTKMLFYQAAAPTGWTAVAVNDKFLRVVSAGGTGGTTGGSGLAPSSTITLAHTHTVASHTHSVPQIPLDYATATSNYAALGSPNTIRSDDSDGATMNDYVAGASNLHRELKNQTKTGTSGGATPATDSQLSNVAFQYADVIVATKD